MKKWVGVIILVLSSAVVFSQTTTLTNPVNDTVKAKWGKIKVVDGVKMVSSNDIIENITQSQEYSTLVSVIADAGLTETFKSKGPITVFAPTNKAFEKLPAGELDTLIKPNHKDDLSYLLTYHAIAGRLTAHDIEKKINANNGEATFITIAGSKLTAKIDGNRNIVLIDENGGQSIISKFDIQQSNGILHIVTSVLFPKPKAM
ncbi:fasciclin domain-containing protein [Mucilaginibacter sp.]|uniref:fasciclin domain-containing protein n=1 Tax=Mucilaginibacter sp. TaxID=1882438 RepID=UPI00283C6E8F|nr:fasciclin domain-containing protein [Mucilaginibacter sp.]MDR3694953.1 fasciclin domain-containing protein [Mucilaginibacter sp.]